MYSEKVELHGDTEMSPAISHTSLLWLALAMASGESLS